jgi:putative YhdH/YhfP family quinone oxidoreductase
MTPPSFKALWVTQTPDGTYSREITEKPLSILPDGEILIRVEYSSLNYKDGLSATGNRGVTRSYPHIPGIDAAGVVIESRRKEFRPGDEVLVTGYDLGSNTWGGWSEFIRVSGDWVVKRPPGLTLHECMVLGTAGFTAGLAVMKLHRNGLQPDAGPVLVTGATGGVGSVAVALLSQLGFSVTALTGKPEEHGFLRSLGAAEISNREAIADSTGKPLLGGRWAGVVDTVGGALLEVAIRQTKLEGTVTCCGNIGSTELHTSLYPFILRGVSLHGIASAFTPMETRLEVWKHLSTDWKPAGLSDLAQDVTLTDLNETYIERIIKGGVRGRVVVSIGGIQKRSG